MDLKVLIGAIIAIFGAIIGVYAILMRHTANPKKHVCSDDIVSPKVCDERHKGVEDCIEAQEKLSQHRFEALTEKVDNGFKEIKELIKNARKRA